mgnify:CR=1 FL=1
MPTIIVPLLCDRTKTDSHGVSERALPWARGLASQLAADVVLLTALDVPPGLLATADKALLRQLLDDWRAGCRGYLEEVARSFDDRVVAMEVDEGDPVLVIVRIARQTREPLVTMASHLRIGLSRLVLGSIAMRVVSFIDCPVLIIGQRVPAAATPVVEVKRALVPLDGSSLAEQALDAVGAIGFKELHVVLFYVPEPGDRDRLGERGLDQDAYLTAVAARLKERGFTVETAVRQGKPPAAIVAAAEELGAELIAMTTHGQGGLRAVLMGSTVEQVLHAATRPVLLVRPRGEGVQ